jgi:hypothetical protein
MRRARKRGRQLCAGIAAGRAQLRSGEKNTVPEVGTSQISAPEVSSDEISHSQISAPEVSSNEVCPSQVGCPEIGVSEVGPYEIGPYEIGTWVVDLVTPSFASHEFAGAQQQGTDISPVCSHVQSHDHIGPAASEMCGLLERNAELTVQCAGRLPRQRFD